MQQCGDSLAQLAQLVQPVCPEADPFLLLRSTYSQPFDERAHSITLQELAQMYLADVQELRGHLLQLQAALRAGAVDLVSPAPPAMHTLQPSGGAQQQQPQQGQQQPYANPLLSIRDVMMRMFTLVASLVAAGRADMFFALHLTNWLTGE